MARELRLPTIVSNNAYYARPDDAVVAEMIAAVRARRSADELDGWRPPSGQAFLRSGMEQRRRFEHRYPGAVGRAALLGVEVAFDLRVVAPDLPPFDVPARHDEMSFLQELTWAGALTRYGTRDESPKAYAQLDHELDVIKQLDFPGYFLVVWDIVRFCREANILCQGRVPRPTARSVTPWASVTRTR